MPTETTFDSALIEIFTEYLREATDDMLKQAELDIRFYDGDKNVVWYLPGLDVIIQNVDGGIRVSRPEHLPDGTMRVKSG